MGRAQFCALPVRLGAARLKPIVIAARFATDPQLDTTFDLHAPPLDADRFAYWKALNDHWAGDRTIVNVEHDNEFSDDLVRDLVECPHPLCTHAYRCFIGGSLRQWVYCPTRNGRWISGGDEWADTASLGFTKIASGARAETLARAAWKFVEHSANFATVGTWVGTARAEAFGLRVDDPGPGGKWHVHWPEIGHYHDYDAEALAAASEFERFCLEVGVEGPLVLPSQRPTAAGRRLCPSQ